MKKTILGFFVLTIFLLSVTFVLAGDSYNKTTKDCKTYKSGVYKVK